MKLLFTAFWLFICLSLSSQSSPWSISAEAGEVFTNESATPIVGLRLNYAITLREQLAFVISGGAERATLKTRLNYPCPKDPALSVPCIVFPAYIKSYETRATLAAGLRQQLGKFTAGIAVRAAYRLNDEIDLTYQEDPFTLTNEPVVTRNTKFGERFDPLPGTVDDPDYQPVGERLRLQTELAVNYAIRPKLSLGLSWRFDGLRANRQQVLGLGAQTASPGPLSLYEGVSRGHYLQVGVTVEPKNVLN